MRVVQGRPPKASVFQTKQGRMLCGLAEELLASSTLSRFKGEVQLVFTSPPFPLLNPKDYGNATGQEYIDWLANFASPLKELLTDDGSIVIEIGNAWERGRPAMSTVPVEALLNFKFEGNLFLCQEFVWHNPAKLPSPAQWVNIERIRVKDSFTRLWWMSPVAKPKANNRRILTEYSSSMKRLLDRGEYNSGRRPSEHTIGEESFLRDNEGAIPPNVLSVSNTRSNDAYQEYCRERNLDVHPARMPLEVAEFFVRFLTEENDIVFDPFAGSNITGSAAERLGRQWISVEADEEYARGSAGRFIQPRLF